MEEPVSRRHFRKHLEPARPLRRCISTDQGYPYELECNVDPCAQAMVQTELKPSNVDVVQFCKILQLHKQKEERICYTRDFLMSLASSPVTMRKPDFLPDHPVVLSEARSWVPEAK